MILYNPTLLIRNSSNKSIVRIIMEEIDIVNIFYYYFPMCHSRYFVMYLQITVKTEFLFIRHKACFNTSTIITVMQSFLSILSSIMLLLLKETLYMIKHREELSDFLPFGKPYVQDFMKVLT